jgi:hypothetical protein
MCSSLGGEVSMESAEVGAGFFTQSLVEALEGKADFNRDHLIHFHELERYAYLRVRQFTLGNQNPVTGRPANFRTFPVARPSGPGEEQNRLSEPLVVRGSLNRFCSPDRDDPVG